MIKYDKLEFMVMSWLQKNFVHMSPEKRNELVDEIYSEVEQESNTDIDYIRSGHWPNGASMNKDDFHFPLWEFKDN